MVEVLLQDQEKLLGEDIKDKRPDLEVVLDPGSKEGKCQFNKGCPNSDLPLKRDRYQEGLLGIKKVSNLIRQKIIDLDSLKSKKILKNKIQEVKVVLGGELTKSLKIKGLKVSKAAREEITSKGGEIT